MWGVPWSDLPLIAWYVLTLVILEGLLSADNALVLAVMVRHLPAGSRSRPSGTDSGGPSRSG